MKLVYAFGKYIKTLVFFQTFSTRVRILKLNTMHNKYFSQLWILEILKISTLVDFEISGRTMFWDYFL
jgi:phage terminase large subunit